MKRSEVSLKAGNKVVVDFGCGHKEPTRIIGFDDETGQFLVADPENVVDCYVVDSRGIANIGPLPGGFQVIEVNGVAIEED